MANLVNIYNLKVDKMLDKKEARALLQRTCDELIAIAKEIYLAQRVLPDHNDYVNSFEVVPLSHHKYLVTNTADTAFWVEFSAHAGGKTEVLGYAPMRLAIDQLASGS